MTDSNLFADRGDYTGIVPAESVYVNGSHYTDTIFFCYTGNVLNNFFLIGDYITFGVDLIDSDTGNPGFIGVQFQRLASALFSDGSLPTGLDLADFDPQDMDNSSSTGAVESTNGIMGIDALRPLDSVALYPVPIPAGLVIFLSALTTLAAAPRTKRR